MEQYILQFKKVWEKALLSFSEGRKKLEEENKSLKDSSRALSSEIQCMKLKNDSLEKSLE